MSEMIGRLRVALGLETAAFEKGAKRATAEINSLGSTAEKVGFRIGSMGKAIAVGAAAFVGGALAAQLRDLVTAGLDHASALGEQAAQLGVSARTLQEYRYAASQAGLSNDEMDAALARLTRTMGDAAAGGKAQVAVFEKLGIAFRDTNGKVRDAGDLLPEIAQALQGVHSPAERAAILVDLFGKSGQKLEPLLAEGAKGVNDLRVAAHELGIVLSDEQIQKADNTADKLGALNQVLSARVAGIVADNANSILSLATALASAAGAAAKFSTEYADVVGLAGGARLGAAVGGPWGAALGGAAGFLYGGNLAQQADDGNMNLAHRTQRLREATAAYRRYRQPGSSKAFAQGTYAFQNLKKQQRLLDQAMRSGGSVAALSPSLGGEVQTVASLGGGRSRKGGGGGSAKDTERTAEAMRKLSVWSADAAKAVGAANDNLESFVSRGPDLEKVSASFNVAAMKAGDFAQKLADLQGRLFPEITAMAQYRGELDLITRALQENKISAEQAAEWRHRLAMEGRDGESAIPTIMSDGGPQVDMDALGNSMDNLVDRLGHLKRNARSTTVEIAKSFKDMADDTIAALNNLANAVQGGGFLNVLSAVVGLGMQLGSVGAFGKSIQTNINSVQKRAWGGPINAGQMYMVGERGPEMFVSGSSGSIVPNHRLGSGGGSMAVQVLPSKYFDVRVFQNVGMVAPAIAQAGGELGYGKVMKTRRRRLA